MSLTLDGRALFALVPRDAAAKREDLVRIDTRRGTVTASVRVAGPADVLQVRTTLWTWDREPPSANSTELDLRDATTLTVLRRITVPGRHLSIASSTAGLWVGTETRLLRVDPHSGRVTRTLVLPRGDGTTLATDPAGRLLYVSQSNVGTCTLSRCTTVLLSERDARTGDLLRSRADLPSVAGGAIAATDSGVWVSYPTGMLGVIQLYRASDLATVVTFGSSPHVDGTNSIRGAVSSGLLWVTDAMAGQIACADPLTGRALSTRALRADGVVSDRTAVYAATQYGLALLKPDAACARHA